MLPKDPDDNGTKPTVNGGRLVPALGVKTLKKIVVVGGEAAYLLEPILNKISGLLGREDVVDRFLSWIGAVMTLRSNLDPRRAKDVICRKLEPRCPPHQYGLLQRDPSKPHWEGTLRTLQSGPEGLPSGSRREPTSRGRCPDERVFDIRDCDATRPQYGRHLRTIVLLHKGPIPIPLDGILQVIDLMHRMLLKKRIDETPSVPMLAEGVSFSPTHHDNNVVLP